MTINLTDELINESIAQYENDGYNDLSDSEVMKALYELQRRHAADKNCFMYGIATPEGGAYLEEFCVSSDRGLMEAEAEVLNDTFETDGYRVVALHAAVPLTDSERAELQQYRKAAINPALNVQFKNGWPVEGSVGVLVDALALPDGCHNLYAAPQLLTDAELQERRHAHTDFMMPPRISNIELRSPLEVEDIYRAALQQMFARAGLRLHDNNQ